LALFVQQTPVCSIRRACQNACMSQVTWRAPDELVERVRNAAARQGRSLNDYLTRLAEAAVDPELADDEVARLRERLTRAGLVLAAGPARSRPDGKAVALVAPQSGARHLVVRFDRAGTRVKAAFADSSALVKSACSTQREVRERVCFAAFDAALRTAAAREGLLLLPA
jgi:hypothetical protein